MHHFIVNWIHQIDWFSFWNCKIWFLLYSINFDFCRIQSIFIQITRPNQLKSISWRESKWSHTKWIICCWSVYLWSWCWKLVSWTLKKRIFNELIKSVCFTVAFAIKCWDCNSYTDRNCGYPFDNRTLFISDCNQIADRNMQKCRKIIQKSMTIHLF